MRRKHSWTYRDSIVLVAAVLAGGCSATPGVKRVAKPITTATRPTYSSNGDLEMQVDLVANRQGDALGAGERGWCILSLRNTSDRPLAFRTVVFAGKVDGPRTPSAVSVSWYSGVGIARLCVAWSNDDGISEWQEVPPPDNPVTVAPNRLLTIARLIQAPKAPGVYTLHVRLTTADAVRAQYTRNLNVPDEPLLMETALAGVSIVELHPPRNGS